MTNINWNSVFAIKKHYNVSDEEICAKLGIPPNQLKIAKDMYENSGLFQTNDEIDLARYDALFKKPQKAKTPTTQKTSNPTTEKPKDPPRKRGRKTTKIKDAYEAIPREPMLVSEFMEQHGVSLSVLRRHRDFDHIPETGKVNVRKYLLEGASEKELCIWRAQPND